MGKREESMLFYYNREQHFADLMNGWLFHGQKEILPSQLQPVDSRYTARSKSGQKAHYRSRYRDVIKKTDSFQIRLILGLELQSSIDYSMPVRVIDYDAVEYGAQITALRHARKSTTPNKPRLSSMDKADRLTPVLTLVLYTGTRPWDGADSLHGILDWDRIPKKLRPYIPNYPVYVLDICHTPDERLLEFSDDIACMFLILKYRKDKHMLAQIVEKYPMFRNVEEDMYDAIWSYTNETRLSELKEQVKKEGGTLNMCQAIREMERDARREGKKIGRKEGLKEGLQKGLKEGQKKVVQINRLNQLLIAEKRFDELERAAKDTDFQNTLLQSYGI